MSWGEVEPEHVADLRAVAHPVRLRMLSYLRGRPMSAAELARELGIAHASASYHLRKLADSGLIDVVEERANRGGREKRYGRRQHAPDDLGLRDDADRRTFLRAVVDEAARRARIAEPTTPRTVGDAEVWVTPQNWESAVTRLRAVLHELLTEQARPPREKGTIPVGVSVLAVRLPDPREHRGADGS